MKKGFTLIEMLVVMAILAVIALITTPIVLDKIEESEQKATLLSAEHYLSAVNISIMNREAKQNIVSDGVYNILSSGNICLKYENNNCVDILEVKVNKKYPKSGYITLVNGEIDDVSIVLDEKTIVNDDNNQLVYSPCTLVSGDKNTKGSKYLCEVKPGVKYNFYVLSQNSDGTTNLIMDQNINSDGTPAGTIGIKKSSDSSLYNLVRWNKEDLSGFGPIEAMQFLYNATKDWINIKPINFTYEDMVTQGTTAEYTSYISIISSNGIAVLTPLPHYSGPITIGSTSEPLRARMPIHISNSPATETMDKITAPYLYDNLSAEGTEPPYAYWTLSSYSIVHNFAWAVHYSGVVDLGNIFFTGWYGVRPVIAVKL